MKPVTLLLVLMSVVLNSGAGASEHRFYLASQHDWGAKRGFYLSFENTSEGAAPTRLETLRLILGAADGRDWRFVTATPRWEYDHDYTARAVVGPKGAELWLDGQSAGRIEGGFVPFDGPMTAAQVPGWASGPAEYAVRLSTLALVAGGKTVRESFARTAALPLPLYLFEPQAARTLAWKPGPDGTFTLTANFRLVRLPDLRTLAPFIDRYGQSVHADWPGKVRSDADLTRAAAEEGPRLRAMVPPKDRDRYGGWTRAGWKEKATGFYRVTRRAGQWWLVTPEGNPCFYVGLNSAPALSWETTPVSDREFLYEWLPPREGPFAGIRSVNQWGQQDGTEYVAFHTANMIRKYGAGWDREASARAVRRMRAWAFSGGGKWGAPEGLPSTPVLYRYDVPNLARHPDVFDSAVRAAFRESLRKQIAPRRRDPLVVGWSLGNEYDEIITKAEIGDIMKKPASVPGRRALVDHALQTLYRGDTAKMARAWAVPEADLRSAAPTPPADDVEALRRFYADAYYGFVYRTVKALDPDHLYMGFWIVPGWWENAEDWRIGARHCDVIGYDRYATVFADESLRGLIRESDKPVLCGEFSFPAWYGGRRGFGIYPVWAEDDAHSGDLYADWTRAAARNPWCVGVIWFQYRDQPLTGRGPGRGPSLVIGEHYAFGMVDGADRPKWDLVARVREANRQAAGWRQKTGPPVK